MHRGSQHGAANLYYSLTCKLFKLHCKVMQMQDRGEKFLLGEQIQTTLICVICAREKEESHLAFN